MYFLAGIGPSTLSWCLFFTCSPFSFLLRFLVHYRSPQRWSSVFGNIERIANAIDVCWILGSLLFSSIWTIQFALNSFCITFLLWRYLDSVIEEFFFLFLYVNDFLFVCCVLSSFVD